ncbi:MFS transporter [Spongisporangium articulatum]|uniref:MFS transporter n=1 Tax=Spongisporangium articulatum TaxID=3362603 RepID=A0ABW8AIM2_9ACTN
MTAVQETPSRTGLHPAWKVAAVTLLALVASAAFRSSTGVLIDPVHEEFGWSLTTISGAVSINLVLFGLTAPFAAALMGRFGVGRVVAVALSFVAVGSGATLLMTQVWQLVVLWGLVIGFATGSMALVLGAVVANAWFVERRGLVMGVFSAANATGQLVVLPAVAWLATHEGWRAAAALTAVLALVLVPLTLAWLIDRPADVGALPYGASEAPAVPAGPALGAGRAAWNELKLGARSPAFWLLAGTFFICGWSTNGLIQTHFVGMAHDHGMPATTAAGLLAVVGVFDIVGTIGSGWLSDRVDPRLLLFMYYGLRGLALLAGPTLMGPGLSMPLGLFIVFYGLDWVATVPPTVALCREVFGLERSSIAFGWVFAAHMVGAGVAAEVAGWSREVSGSYDDAWWLAGGLCILAAFAIFGVRAPARTPAPDGPPPVGSDAG